MQRVETIGGLEVICDPGDGDSTTVVLLHGYGADFRDLAPLGRMLKEPKGATWIYPNAPLTVPIGPHMTGRAWFPIDMAELERAMMMGTHRDFSKMVPPGFLEAREALCRFLDALAVPPDKLILGGFSQGAMLACELALTLDEAPKAALLMSPTLVAESRWREAAAKRADLPVFISHGKVDPLLSFEATERLKDLLETAGLDVAFHPFYGGHEIPPNVLSALAEFLRTR